MAKCIRVERKNAEKARRELIAKGLLDNSYLPARDSEYVYFAVKKAPARMKILEKGLELRVAPGKSLREELTGQLSKSEAEALVGSFDILGDIAVLEIPDALMKKQQLIAEAVLRNHRNVKVVVKKIGGTSGEFRIRPVEVVAGEHRTSTVCREAGCGFELDLNEVYFSSRLEMERTRIAGLVKKGEHVLVPFAGVGPYAIRIGKAQPTAKVLGIELNHSAVEFFWKNIDRNGAHNVIAMKGDVAHCLHHEFRDWADRVVMPHPSDGARFLPAVIPCIRKGGMLHYYSFGDAKDPYAKAEGELKQAAGKLGRKAHVLFRRVARPFSKDRVQVVVDAKII